MRRGSRWEVVRLKMSNGSLLELAPVSTTPAALSDEQLAKCYEDNEWAAFENRCAAANDWSGFRGKFGLMIFPTEGTHPLCHFHQPRSFGAPRIRPGKCSALRTLGGPFNENSKRQKSF